MGRRTFQSTLYQSILSSVLLGTLSLSPGIAGAADLDILATDAAAAFRAGDYQAAADGFRRLAEDNQANLDALRYYAISLDRAGRPREAIEVFARVLQLDPNSASTRYHLGVSLYKARLADHAIEQFQYVLQLASESKYAELAREYIRAIAEQRAAQQRQGAPGVWGLFAQLAYDNDDNIPAAPKDEASFAGEREGNRGSEYLAIDLNFLRTGDWLGNLKVSAYGAQYNEDEFDGFEVLQYAGGFLLQRNGHIGSLPAGARLDYQFSSTELGEDHEPYVDTHEVTLSGLLHFTDTQVSALFAEASDDDFESDGANPPVTSRDAFNWEAGLRHTIYFAGRRGDFSAHVVYGESNADGVNYNKEWLGGGLSLRLPLPWRFQVKFGADYTDDEYPDFVGPSIRETEITEYSVEVSRWFGRHFLARLRWSQRDEDSSVDVLSYRREAWGLVVSYVY